MANVVNIVHNYRYINESCDYSIEVSSELFKDCTITTFNLVCIYDDIVGMIHEMDI